MYFVEDLNSVHDISKGSRERNWPLSGDTHCVSGKKKKSIDLQIFCMFICLNTSLLLAQSFLSEAFLLKS